MKTYPESNEMIVELLRLKDDLICIYAAARIEELERVFDRACMAMSDQQCPKEYGLGKWLECVTCSRMSGDRHDVARNVACWKRYFMDGDDR